MQSWRSPAFIKRFEGAVIGSFAAQTLFAAILMSRVCGNCSSIAWWAYGQSLPKRVMDLCFEAGQRGGISLGQASFNGHIIVLNSFRKSFSFFGSFSSTSGSGSKPSTIYFSSVVLAFSSNVCRFLSPCFLLSISSSRLIIWVNISQHSS